MRRELAGPWGLLRAVAKLAAGRACMRVVRTVSRTKSWTKAGLAEADFGFGGVDVDVDLLRGHLEEEKDDGEGCGRDDVAVGLGERVEDELVADEALVDEDVDGVAVELLQLGLGDEAGDAEVAGIGRGVVERRASTAAARAGRRG